jgi:hypothetical protein
VGSSDGYVGDAYFEDTEALHGHMQPYAALNPADRERVRAAIPTFIAERCVGETVEFRTPVLVAIGYRIWHSRLRKIFDGYKMQFFDIDVQ